MRRRTLLAPTVPIVLAAAALALLPALPAAAHNYVVSSTPAEGETLTAVPEFFVVTTNDALLDLTGEGAGFVMRVTDESGLYYGDGCVSVQGASMAMAGALGGAGDYTLAFQAISGDGHTISDQLTFRYEPAAGADVQAGVASAPDCGGAAGDSDAGGVPAESADPGTAGEAGSDDEAGTVLGLVAGIVAGLAVLGAILLLVVRRGRAVAGTDDPAAGASTP